MPSVRDLAVAAAALVALQLDVWLLEPAREGRPLTALAAVALAGALVVRRAHPLALAAAFATVLVTSTAAGAWLTSLLAAAVVGMLVAFSVALHLPRRRALLAAAVLVLGAWTETLLASTAEYSLASDLVFTALVVVGLPWAAGRALRERQQRAEELEQLTRQLADEREQRAHLAVLEERNRIAREMHDVVAHSVSLMVVQAGAARRMLDSDTAQSRQALLAVEDVGREALAELRRVLGLLRGTDERVALTPQPGTADLAALVASTCRSGLAVDLDVSGTPHALQPGVDLTVYRVVQEALTNTRKHAGAARAQVRLDWHDDVLEVRVTDDGRGPLIPAQGAGQGLVGMRERLTAYGGHVEAGARPEGGFAVRATIPLARVRA